MNVHVHASTVASGKQELPNTGVVETRMGQLRFEGGYPSNETVDRAVLGHDSLR
ncbi:MAG: hypothetical protein WCA08_01460 [Desulfoferrobacter sp.]